MDALDSSTSAAMASIVGGEVGHVVVCRGNTPHL